MAILGKVLINTSGVYDPQGFLYAYTRNVAAESTFGAAVGRLSLRQLEKFHVNKNGAPSESFLG